MQSKLLFGVTFILTTAVVVVGFLLHNLERQQAAQVCFENHCFDVELAVTPGERRNGLMFKETLEENSGMLFVFEGSGVHSFWMKNVPISLDIIWFDEGGRVVDVAENAQPCPEMPCPSIGSGKEANYVVEINGGAARRLGLKVGDKLTIKY